MATTQGADIGTELPVEDFKLTQFRTETSLKYKFLPDNHHIKLCKIISCAVVFVSFLLESPNV